jgi:hypothetical protein
MHAHIHACLRALAEVCMFRWREQQSGFCQLPVCKLLSSSSSCCGESNFSGINFGEKLVLARANIFAKFFGENILKFINIKFNKKKMAPKNFGLLLYFKFKTCPK